MNDTMKKKLYIGFAVVMIICVGFAIRNKIHDNKKADNKTKTEAEESVEENNGEKDNKAVDENTQTQNKDDNKEPEETTEIHDEHEDLTTDTRIYDMPDEVVELFGGTEKLRTQVKTYLNGTGYPYVKQVTYVTSYAENGMNTAVFELSDADKTPYLYVTYTKGADVYTFGYDEEESE